MPIKSRMIEEKINELSNRKLQLQTELETARIELKTAENAIIKGVSDTDALVSIQTRINVIEQTLIRFDSNIAALEAELIAQKNLERKREIFKKIKPLDDEAEKAGNRFIELYTDIENLSYARFAEMSSLITRIADLKAEFGRHIQTLIPEVNSLKSRHLPELEMQSNRLIAELENICKLRVLRSGQTFSHFQYVTDDDYIFRLPESDLSDWIWSSIRVIRKREQLKQRDLPEIEKTGFLSKIFK